MGWGADGQLGLGNDSSQFLPMRILGHLQDKRVLKISTTVDFSLALTGMKMCLLI